MSWGRLDPIPPSYRYQKEIYPSYNMLHDFYLSLSWHVHCHQKLDLGPSLVGARWEDQLIKDHLQWTLWTAGIIIMWPGHLSACHLPREKQMKLIPRHESIILTFPETYTKLTKPRKWPPTEIHSQILQHSFPLWFSSSPGRSMTPLCGIFQTRLFQMISWLPSLNPKSFIPLNDFTWLELWFRQQGGWQLRCSLRLFACLKCLFGCDRIRRDAFTFFISWDSRECWRFCLLGASEPCIAAGKNQKDADH